MVRKRDAPAKTAAAKTAAVKRGAEIVAAGLDAGAIDRLRASGFTILGERDSQLFGTRVARLGLPRGWSIDQATGSIRQQSSNAIAVRNDLYRRTPGGSFRPAGTGCGDKCEAFEITRWTQAEGRCSAGVRIGVIDTGVDADHESLSGSQLTLHSTRSPDRAVADKEHGTAVVSLLTGRPTSSVVGLAPEARIFAVDAFHRTGNGSSADTYDLVAALDWLSRQAVQTVNLSFSGPDNALLQQAIERIMSQGSVVIAAAGNSASKSSGYPARFEGVIAVSAIDARMRPARQSNRGSHIAFSAPGVGIVVARPPDALRKVDGTSFAAPFVTAAFAAGQGRRAGTPAEVLRLLQDSARDLGPPGRDPVYGWGVIQYSALPKC